MDEKEITEIYNNVLNGGIYWNHEEKNAMKYLYEKLIKQYQSLNKTV